MSETVIPNFNDRVFIVTGASKGFGFAIAKQMVESGAKVGLIARGEEALQKAVAELGEESAIGVAASVSDKADMDAAVKKISEKFGKLDGIVNNAGIARPGKIESMPVDEIQQQLTINITGLIVSCQAAIPYLSGDNPRIINISSASAFHFDEMAHLAIYAASKAAVERLSHDLRQELQDRGIGVTVVRPGAASTEFASEFDGDRLVEGIKAWADTGPYMNIGMDVGHVAEAVCWSLSMPKGVAVDMLEIRPNKRVDKIKL